MFVDNMEIIENMIALNKDQEKTLVIDGILTASDLEDINKNESIHLKNRRLLELLLSPGRHQCRKFWEFLQKIDHYLPTLQMIERQFDKGWLVDWMVG